jgi:hypothetical protein
LSLALCRPIERTYPHSTPRAQSDDEVEEVLEELLEEVSKEVFEVVMTRRMMNATVMQSAMRVWSAKV